MSSASVIPLSTAPVPAATAEATPPPLTDVAGMSPRQKAAVVLLALDSDRASAVLGHLAEPDLEALALEIARIGPVPAEVIQTVLEEFAELVTGPPGRGGLDVARDLLTAAVGVERGIRIAERVGQKFVTQPFAFLDNLDPRQLLSFVSDEHPQTIALVLAHLSPELAAEVMSGLDHDLLVRVAHRIAVMDRTSPELIGQVELALDKRLSSLGVAGDLSAVGGLRPLVDILNRSDRATERQVLEGLDELDVELAAKVRAQMFMFDDIVTLDDRSLQLVLRRVQVSDLAVALKGVAEQVRAKVTRHMSARAALNLADEADVLGPVRVTVVEDARAAVVAVIRELEESGELIIARNDDDVFVA